MTPALHHIGEGRHPVVTVDGFTGDWRAVVAIAAALAPFGRARGSAYPGLRRVITPADTAAQAYAEAVLEAAAPFIGGAFDVDAFDWIEASFSIVTDPPEALIPAQRAPHFDATDAGHLAILHHLNDLPGTGTAFYRHRATGIEALTADTLPGYTAARAREPVARGYVDAADAQFERIGLVEARPDRLVLYRGRMLHSGIIPPALPLDADPRRGRLTANLFVQAHGVPQ